MARLLLPRARVEPEGVEQPIPEARSPLPRWQTIPLDAKFPVLPAPKGEVTFVTTKMGESPFKSSQRKDFDLSDPYNRKMRNEYQPLFDPYLKGWFAKPHVQRQMKKHNLVTERGNVPCSVRDFNEYRLYLRHQAVSRGGPIQLAMDEDLNQAQVRKRAILRKTQMKAEVFGVEVKYKSLKAQQTELEKEEDRRNQFLQKTLSLEERQRQRILLKERESTKKLSTSQNQYSSKLNKIKEKAMLTRKRTEQKLLEFEIEAQDKLNKLDFLREQRFQELDQKRKHKWRMRRLHQMQEMDKAQRQKQRVQAEMRIIKQRYETHMARKAARDEVNLNLIKESRFKLKERDNEVYARRLAQVLKNTRYMTFGPIESGAKMHHRTVDGAFNRQASLWMVQEVLNRLGLTEESLRLKNHGYGSMSYLNDMDQAINVAVRRLESVTVLGEEQEMLSRLVHLVWRSVKTAYPGRPPPATTTSREKGDEEKEGTRSEEEGKRSDDEEEPEDEQQQVKEAEQKIMAETLDDVFTTAEQLAWFFPDDDDGEESEQAVKISMLVTGEMQRNLVLPTALGDPRPPDSRLQRRIEERMDEFFKTRMRMTETDALAVEAELFSFLDSLKGGEMNPTEMKRILAMCLQLANHDVIKRSDPCGELETNPKGRTYLAFEPSDDEDVFVTIPEGWGKTNRISTLSSSGGRSMEQRSQDFQADEREVSVKTGSDKSDLKEEAEIASALPDLSSPTAVAAAGGDNDTAAAAIAADIDTPVALDAAADALPVDNDARGDKDVGAEFGQDGLEAQDATENASSATVNLNVNRNNAQRKGLSNRDSASDESVSDERRVGEEVDTMRSGSRNSHSSGGSYSDAVGVRSNGSSYDSESFSTEHIPTRSEQTMVKDKDTLDHRNGKRQRPSDGAPNPDLKKTLPAGETNALNVSQNRMGADADPELADSEQVEETEEEEEETKEEQNEEKEEPSLDDEAEDTILEEEPEEDRSEPRTEEPSTLTRNLTQTGTLLEETREAEILEDEEEDELADTRGEMAFEEAVRKDDIVALAEQMLTKIQEREKLKGVSIPQSRLLRFMAMNLSLLWKPGPEDRFHKFQTWLLEPTIPETIRSLIYNVKRRKFSADLQRGLAKAVVFVCLEGIADEVTPLTDRLVKVILQRFMADLEKNEVSLAILEKVLKAVVETYADYIRKDLNFSVSVMILDCLGLVHDMVLSEEVTRKAHLLPAIRDWRSLSADTKDNLECGKWANLLHRASVILRLDMQTEADRTNLVKLMTTLCTEYLKTDTPNSLSEMLEMMRTRLTKLKTKKAFSIDLAVNAVVVLSGTLHKSKISSTTLLPGAQNLSQSACTEQSASVLGPYTTGEAVILLVLDKLASDMAHSAVDEIAQDYMATAIIDLLVTHYSYDREELKGGGVVPALDNVIYQLQTQALGFHDVKLLLAAILGPYLSTTVKPLLKGVPTDRERTQRAGLSRFSLTKEQSGSLLALVTQVFVSFLHGVEARLRRGGANIDCVARKILSLYIWRAIAGLAKQAKTVLIEMVADYEMESVKARVKASDSIIIERILRTVVDVEEIKVEDTSSRATFISGAGQDGDTFIQFLHAVLDANFKPGYIPVADSTMTRETSTFRSIHRKPTVRIKRSTRQSVEVMEDPQDTPQEKGLRKEYTPIHLDRAIRREIIAAAREICDTLVSTKALRQLTVKTADSFAGVVFVVEKLLSTIYTKFWTLLMGIRRGKIEPESVRSSLLGPQQCEDLPQLHLGREATMRVLQEAILELEDQYTSAITLSRMVESLSRTAQKLAPSNDPAAEHLRCQPHPILASASPLLLAQWMRASLLAALRALTIVLSGGRCSPAMMSKVYSNDTMMSLHMRSLRRFASPSTFSMGTSTYKSKTQVVDPDAILLVASYVVVHNFLSQVRDTVERQKTHDGFWLATRVAGTRESSHIRVPIEILDRVFARLAGIMQTLSETVEESEEENDGRVPERSCDLASTIISQVTNAVSYHVEIGQFPFIRINDLLREFQQPSTDPGTSGAGQSAAANRTTNHRRSSNQQKEGTMEMLADTSTNARMMNNYSLNNSGVDSTTFPDPVQLMENRWSSYLFHSLMNVVSRLDMALKEGLEISLQRQESMTTDARVRARAFISAMLDKIRKNASSGEFLLFNGQESIQLWRRKQEQPMPLPTPSEAPSTLSTVASPVVSRKTSQAGVGMRPTVASVNTNVNKTGSQLGRDPRKLSSSICPGKAKTTRSGSSLMSYLRNLLRPVCQTDSAEIFSGNVSNNKTVDVISEILQAGYSVSLDFLHTFEEDREPAKSVSIVIPSLPPQTQPDVQSFLIEQKTQAQQCKGKTTTPEDAETFPSGSSVSTISVLLLDLLLAHLVSTLERKTRGVQSMASNMTLSTAGVAGKQGGPSPYVSSYLYRTPDPYGRFYAEVVDRGRRWCQMVDVDASQETSEVAASVTNVTRMQSLARDSLASDAKDSSGPSSKDVSGEDLTGSAVIATQSVSSQPSSTAHTSQATCGSGPRGVASRRPIAGKGQERRVSTFRKEVHKLSAAYAVDNTNNSWRKRSRQTSVDATGKRGGKLAPPVARGVVHGKKTQSVRSKLETAQPKSRTAADTRQTRSSYSDTPPTKSGLKESSVSQESKASPAVRKHAGIGAERTVSTNVMTRNKLESSEAKSSIRQRCPRDAIGSVLHRRRTTESEAGKVNDCKEPKPVDAAVARAVGAAFAWTTEEHQQEDVQSETITPEPQQAKWQPPTIEVIYHVPEAELAQAEEHLKQCRQAEVQVSHMTLLSKLDMQLLLLALLSRDLPRETAVLAASLRGPERLQLRGLEDVADLLSLLDHVLADLPPKVLAQAEKHGRQRDDANGKEKTGLKVKRLLKAAGKRLEVSQRSAGAVHSLLRLLESGMLDDATLTKCLQACTAKVGKNPALDLNAVKSQLKASLVQLVERLEEGHAPKCMTTSDWARLANEILHQAMLEHPVHSPSRVGLGNSGHNDISVENLSDCHCDDDKRADNDNDDACGGGGGDDVAGEEYEDVCQQRTERPDDHSKMSSRSGSRSASQTSTAASATSDISRREENRHTQGESGEEPENALYRGDQTAVRSWSMDNLSLASSSSTHSASSSSSKSSVSSASSSSSSSCSSSSSSCQSAVSHASPRSRTSFRGARSQTKEDARRTSRVSRGSEEQKTSLENRLSRQDFRSPSPTRISSSDLGSISRTSSVVNRGRSRTDTATVTAPHTRGLTPSRLDASRLRDNTSAQKSERDP